MRKSPNLSNQPIETSQSQPVPAPVARFKGGLALKSTLDIPDAAAVSLHRGSKVARAQEVIQNFRKAS